MYNKLSKIELEVDCLTFLISWHNLSHTSAPATPVFLFFFINIMFFSAGASSLTFPFFSSVTQSCRILCNPMDYSMPGSLSSTIPQSLLKFMSIKSVMLSNHLILCHPLLLLPSTFPSIRVFSNELALRIRWPKYWSLSSVQFSHSVVSDSLQPHESQHARPPCCC